MFARAFVVASVAAVAAGKLAERVRMEPDVEVFRSVNWLRGPRVSPEEMIEVEFWLKHDPADLADFHDLLVTLSTPGSQSYAQWLSAEEVVEKLAPSREALDSVIDYCVNELGAKDVHINKHKSVVEVTLGASTLEDALETRLYHHTHKTRPGVDIVRATEPYSLPARVARHVSVVSELIRFPHLRDSVQEGIKRHKATKPHAKSNATADAEWSACGAEYDTYVNPQVLAKRYGFTYPFKTAAPSNTIAVGEFQGEYYDDDDLSDFSTTCALETPVTVSTTVGGNVATRCTTGLGACIESLLDIEYAGSIAGDIPLTVVYSTDYALLDYANTLTDMDTPPLINSVSYGNDEVQQTGSDFMESVNTAFMKLSSQGVSILFAAGDQGVWGRSGLGQTFHPDFPGGSPYVTTVGGTDFSTATTIGEETTWNDGGSGFSDEFATPDFQTTQVAAYLSETETPLPKDSMYNAEGRGYPDLSALAGEVNPYLVTYSDGAVAAVSGTSASCPVVAAIMAQLNDARLAAGKPSLGWLNPFLYSVGQSGYNDVTTGKTDGGLTGGFPATTGWDAATGFGTPIFSVLLDAAMSY